MSQINIDWKIDNCKSYVSWKACVSTPLEMVSTSRNARQMSLLPGVNKNINESFWSLGVVKHNAPKLGTTGMFLLLKTFRILVATALLRS